MRLVLVTKRLPDETEEERSLKASLLPLVQNKDGHFLATLAALILSLLEGKTDCPLSGVFGAGKTRAAAAIIAGLITVDPTLKIMVLTKENVASQAFAEHVIRLDLPACVESKFGRMVGYMALHNNTTCKTRIDIESASRHDVLRSKQVIIGCGGGFRHECANKCSPVAQWMSEVDSALQDESQQFGNLDEAAAIARLPRKCLVVWLGDHRQTPGGLRKSDAARKFRQKLLRRPVALRGDSFKVQPNTLYKVVSRYLAGTPAAPGYPVANLLNEGPCLSPAAELHLQNMSVELLGCYDDWLTDLVPRTALAVLWLAMHQVDVDSMVALTLAEAARVSGRQNWSLILSSSARVSRVTYEAVIAVRYPELDHAFAQEVQFGTYLADQQAAIGGFLPIFWLSSHDPIRATLDPGSMVDWISGQLTLEAGENGCLAVLHNRNDMVGAFNGSEWVSSSKGSVVSRGVTSCAGMICFLMCPLDTKGLVGAAAATVVGSRELAAWVRNLRATNRC